MEDLDGEIMTDATITRIMGNHIPCAGYAARSSNQRKEEFFKKKSMMQALDIILNHTMISHSIICRYNKVSIILF